MIDRYASLLLCSILVSGLSAQTVFTAEEYDVLKGHGQLPDGPIVISGPSASGGPSPWVLNRGGGACDCWIAPDGTYSLAMAPNDDLSSTLIALPFTFNLFGTGYTSVYINNNGNVSFVNPYGTYTSMGFPSADYTMVAPFWADVDTRGDDGMGLNGGEVVYKVTANALYVNWVEVGYFSSMTDKHNTFQLIITDGTDPVVPGGNNVSFCYQDMQWTTGSASMGIDGFGGVPATVGVNHGNGVDHSQVGRFGIDDDSYTGPYADTSGISWLDSTHFYLNTAGANMPPIFGSTFGCDTVLVQLTGGGDRDLSSTYHLIVLPGKPEESITCVSDAPSLPNFETINIGPVPYLDLDFTIDASEAVPGTHFITFTATNDAADPVSSTYVLEVYLSPTAGLAQLGSLPQNLLLRPTLAEDMITAQWPGTFGAERIELLSSDGRLLRAWSPGTRTGACDVDVRHLSLGEYLLRVTGKQGSLTARFTRIGE